MTLAGKIGDARWLLAQQLGGNAEGVRRASGLLAGLAVCQFWPVRASQPDIGDHADFVCTSCSRCCCNVPRTRAGLRKRCPYLAGADARGREDHASPTLLARSPTVMSGGWYRRHVDLSDTLLDDEGVAAHWASELKMQSIRSPSTRQHLHADRI